ncbi:MAG: amino acid adenylation domain-containing protein, partial [Sarcina sp.]
MKYRLSRSQKNLYNLEKASRDSSINNLIASIDINNDKTIEETVVAIQKTISKLNLLRIQIDENLEQYISDVQEQKIKVIKFTRENSLVEWIEEWKIKSIFALNNSLCEFKILVDLEKTKIVVIYKVHHIISDIETMKQIANYIISFLENTENISEEKIFLDITESKTFSKEYWKNKLSNYESEKVIKKNTKNLETNTIKYKIDSSLLSAMITFSNTNNIKIFDLYVATLLYWKSRIDISESASIGLGVGRGNDNENKVVGPLTKVMPLIINNVQKYDEIVHYCKAISNEVKVLHENSNLSMFDLLEIYEQSNLNDLIEITCIEKNSEIYDEFVQKGYEFKFLNNKRRHNPINIIVDTHDLMNKIEVVYEFKILEVQESFIRRLHDLIEAMLRKIVSNDAKNLSDLELITKYDSEILAKNFISKPIKYKNIIEMFKDVSDKHPNNIAIKYKEEAITYKYLDSESDLIKHKLDSYGVKSGDIIASSLTGINSIIAILGIMKQGAVYLPIDRKLPRERRSYILGNSRAKIICLETNMYDIEDIKILDFSEKNSHSTILKIDYSNISGDDIAYAIYTSGSTGKPKGTLVKHKGVVNMCTYFQERLDIGEFDNIQQFASHSFDASILEIFGAILTGAKLILLDDEIKSNPVKVQNIWCKENITFAIIPPVYMSLLDFTKDISLRYLMTAGEEARWSFVEKCSEKVSYINAYGPTEATVWSTTWFLNDIDKLNKNERVPIGKPLYNVKCTVLQENRVCGIGVKGELCISGKSLAHGYINNDLLTNKVFTKIEGFDELFYRTGDYVKWNEAGELEFLGRIDNQVKIRGHRIEIDEITEYLNKHENIEDSYTLIIESAEKEKELISVIVQKNKGLKIDLKSYLSKYVPEYMVPTRILEIDALPITLNGKVDKRIVIDFINKSKKIVVEENFTDSLYNNIIKIYESVLGSVDLEYSFYNLGGDSIKAIKIVSKLRSLGVNTNVKKVIENQPIRILIDELSSNDNIKNYIDEVLLKHSFGELNNIQKLFFEKKLLVESHFNQHITLEGLKSVDEKILKLAYTKLIDTHEQLQVNFNEKEFYLLKNKKNIDFNIYDLTSLDENTFNEEFENICTEAQNNFDLEYGALINLSLIRNAKTDYIFIAAHHLIVDGVSWRIIIEDLTTFYLEFANSNSKKVFNTTINFREWTKFANENGANINYTENKYWVDLNKKLSKLNASSDYFTSQIKNHIVTNLDLELSRKLLNNMGKKIDAKINELCLGALVNSASCDNFPIVIESHGREEFIEGIETDKTIGWFTSFYPVILEKKQNVIETIYSNKNIIDKVPKNGFNYLYFRNKLKALEEKVFMPNIIFNYMGEMQKETSEFKIVDMPVGERSSKANGIWFSLIITAKPIEEQLQFTFEYDENLYDKEDILLLKDNFFKAIEVLASELEFVTDNNKEKNLIMKTKEYNLTPMQENFLFSRFNNVNEDLYLVQVILETNKRLDEEKCIKSINKLADIHSVLRSNIKYVNDTASIIENKESNIKIAFYDNKESSIFDVIDREKREHINLENDSMLKIAVIQNEDKSEMIWSFNHILMDGWCLGILMENFVKLYTNNSKKIEIDDKYYEYSKLIEKNYNEEALNYWRNLLDGYESKKIMLPEKTLGEVKEERTVKITEVVLENSLKNVMLDISKKKNIPISTIMECAWGITLQKYSLTDDIVVGKVVSGRNHNITNIEKMVGLFINTIPLRITGNHNLKFLELLKLIDKQNRKSEKYNFVSLSDINSFSRDCVNSLISFEQFTTTFHENDLELKHVKTIEKTNYDLNLNILNEDEIRIKILFNSD